MKRRGVWALAGCAVLAVYIALGTRSLASQAESDDLFVLGNPQARFTITEYADLECPYCREAYPILKQFIAEHDDVNWQWRHLPLAIHGDAAIREARAATCAGLVSGKQAFWDATETIYKKQGDGISGARSGLHDQAEAFTVQKCTVENEDVAKVVAKHVDEAQRLGVDATPTLLIRNNQSGKSLKLAGVTTADSLLSALDWLASE